MVRKPIAVLGIFAALLPALACGSTRGADEPTPYVVDNNTIAKIRCGNLVGTGIYVGNGLIATARHVIKPGGCVAAGLPAEIVASSLKAGRDFALLAIAGRAEYRALIDCGGFREGELYLATGYAEGAAATVTQVLTGSAARSRDIGFAGLMVFRGAVTQGMSGGPINRLDNGALVGIINANTEDGITHVLGLPLTDTTLCKGKGNA